MAVDILVTTLDRHKDLGELCFRDISEAIAFSRLLASNERVPRALQAKGIKASIPFAVGFSAFDLERMSFIDSVLC